MTEVSKRDVLSDTTESKAAGANNQGRRKREIPSSDSGSTVVEQDRTNPDMVVRFTLPDEEPKTDAPGNTQEDDQQSHLASAQATNDGHLSTEGAQQGAKDAKAESANEFNERTHMEVWFPGCHSGELCYFLAGSSLIKRSLDVGGGGAKSASNGEGNLANVSLAWMVKEAIGVDVGLLFRADAFSTLPGVSASVSPHLHRKGGSPEPVLPNNKIQESAGEVPRDNRAQQLSSDLPAPREETGGRSAPYEASATSEMVDSRKHSAERDACAEIHDPLKSNPFWWLLEYIPLWERRVTEQGRIEKGFK